VWVWGVAVGVGRQVGSVVPNAVRSVYAAFVQLERLRRC